MGFIHLHTHSKYSINDAMINSKSLAKKLKEDGVTKYAITEHGCIMNMPEAYLNLKKAGIELIVGMETYVAPRLNTNKEGRADAANYHLVLLCENDEGYYNLKQLASDAAINGFYYKARTDKKMLKKYHKGLIALSACLGGSVNQFLLEGNYEKAKKEALEYENIFGKGNFFLEIQRHGLEEQDKINPDIIRLSRETGIPLVATNDCHYLDKEDWQAHDILMAIQANTNIYDTKRKVYGSHEFYVKTQKEMTDLFSDIPEAINNTVKIANRCHVEIDFETSKLPPFTLPKGYKGSNADFFNEIIYEGARKKYKNITDEIVERIEYEKSVISNMGFINYFLITWDFFRFCKTGAYNIGDKIDENWKPILTGPGRGSCAGSIISYVLDITKIDPLKYDLLFERFLDPSRISFPDIDSDFQTSRRQEVIDYVIYKYGRENTAQIITFNTMAARSAIRRVGKAINMNLSKYDKIAKMIPQELGITIEKALLINQELNSLYETDEDVRELINFAMKLEGLPNSTSTHAAGVLITDNLGVSTHVPMWVNDKAVVAQYDKDILESMKLLKMDFLGLRNLDVIDQCIEFIKINHNVDIDIEYLYTIPDLKPLELIREGKTAGIFQLEGDGMTSFMKDLQPKDIEDIIAGISMYRPGPMKKIPEFLANKRDPKRITYKLSGLEKVLDTTYGIMIYQEQAMKSVIEIAGYEKSDSDGFRKVIAKKIEKLMPLHRRWFIFGRKEKDYNEDGELVDYTPIPGGIALGHNQKDLEEFFDEMEDFGRYCFNKSHSASYAYIAYITMYLMYYYAVEFMAALLNSVQDDREKISKYINYARKVLGIEISEPNINKSVDMFIPDGNKIYYTLKIKGASKTAISFISKDRVTNGICNLLPEFLTRYRNVLNKGTYEGLIASGALSDFGMKKSVLLATLDEFWDGPYKKTKEKEKRFLKKFPNHEFNFEEVLIESSKDIFPDINEFPREVELRLEKEFLGLYLTDNPLLKYAYTIKTTSNIELSDLKYEVDETTGAIIMNKEFRDRQPVRFVGILNTLNEISTKKKTLMARPDIEDLSDGVTALIWPRDYSLLKNKIVEGNIYIFDGYIMMDEDKPQLIIDDATEINDVVTERLVITTNDEDYIIELINDIKNNKIARGDVPLYIIKGQNQILLKKDFWVNKDYIIRNYEAELKVW